EQIVVAQAAPGMQGLLYAHLRLGLGGAAADHRQRVLVEQVRERISGGTGIEQARGLEPRRRLLSCLRGRVDVHAGDPAERLRVGPGQVDVAVWVQAHLGLTERHGREVKLYGVAHRWPSSRLPFSRASTSASRKRRWPPRVFTT